MVSKVPCTSNNLYPSNGGVPHPSPSPNIATHPPATNLTVSAAALSTAAAVAAMTSSQHHHHHHQHHHPSPHAPSPHPLVSQPTPSPAGATTLTASATPLANPPNLTAASLTALTPSTTMSLTPPPPTNAATTTTTTTTTGPAPATTTTTHPAPPAPMAAFATAPSVRLPQHLVMTNPLSNFSPATTTLRLTEQRVPPIFQNMALRRGKWNPEEEHFANALIEEFEKGTIKDCENGCTLRAFLSRKLHCAPMRISKKYAGKSIGKHVFLSRTIPSSNPATAVPGTAPPGAVISAPDNSEKLRQLEFQFHMSLLQEGANANGGVVNPASLMVGQPMGIFGNDINLMTTATTVPPAVSLAPTQFFQNGTQLQGTIMNFPTLGAPQSAPTAPLQWPLSMVSPTATTGVSQIQSLQNAYKDALSSSTPTVTSSSTLPTTTASTGPTTLPPTVSAPIATLKKELHGSSSLNSAPSDTKHGTYLRHPGEPASSSQSHEIPNLVTGFDQLKQKISSYDPSPSTDATQNEFSKDQWNDTANSIPTLDPTSYMGGFSPTITSKSFDDLHQFIGKDCAYDGGGNTLNKQVKQEESSESGKPCAHTPKKQLEEEGTNNFILNDSSSNAYALFAQQSAIAVSKHSAYCRNDQVFPLQNESGSTEMTKSMSPSNELPLSHCIPPESEEANVGDQKVSNGTAFNAANLKLHSKAVEESLARADKVSLVSERNEKVTLQPGTNGADFNRNNMLGSHSNIISGSERTDSAGGSSGVNSSASGSCTGSDNASDNSDSISDEGRLVSNSRKRESNSEVDVAFANSMSPQSKRQKRALEEGNLSQ